jgi:hypothetical protein
MSILTGRELEFLASLRTSWRRLYWNELARLLKEDHNPRDARHEAVPLLRNSDVRKASFRTRQSNLGALVPRLQLTCRSEDDVCLRSIADRGAEQANHLPLADLPGALI